MVDFFLDKSHTDKVYNTGSTHTQEKKYETSCTVAEQRPKPRHKRIKSSTPQTWGCLSALGIRRAHSFAPKHLDKQPPTLISDTNVLCTSSLTEASSRTAESDDVSVWERIGLVIV